jgi:hypothetical protein
VFASELPRKTTCWHSLHGPAQSRDLTIRMGECPMMMRRSLQTARISAWFALHSTIAPLR